MKIEEAFFEDDPWPYGIVLADSYAQVDDQGWVGKHNRKIWNWVPEYGAFLIRAEIDTWLEEHAPGAVIIFRPCIMIKFKTFGDAFKFKCDWTQD